MRATIVLLALVLASCGVQEAPRVQSVFGGGSGFGGGGTALFCGDARVSPGEDCDDANNTSGDGCSAACEIEDRYVCSGSPSTCLYRFCGDGVIVGGEQCDDGNNTSGDGCSATCVQEAGYRCAGEPSTCCAPFPGAPKYVFLSSNIDGNSNDVTIVNGFANASWVNTGATSGDGVQAGATITKPNAILDAMSGQDVVHFNGRGAYLDINGSAAGLSFVENTGIFDIFLVMRPGSIGTNAFEGLISNDGLLGGKGFSILVDSTGAIKTFVYSGTAANLNYDSAFTLNPGKKTTIEWRGDGTNFKINKNGGTYETAVFANAFTTGDASATTKLMRNPSTFTNWNADVAALLIYSSELNGTDRTTVTTSLACRYPAPALERPIAALGDSITATGLTTNSTPYPTKLTSTLAPLYHSEYPVTNNGVSGDRVSSISSRFTSGIHGKGYYALLLEGGVNDIIQDDATAAATYAGLAAIVSTALADGLKVCWTTILPCKGNGACNTVPRQQAILDTNTLIRAHAGLSGDLTIYDGYTDFDDGTGTMQTAYDGTADGQTPDGLHPGQAGVNRLASKFKDCLGL